MKFGNPNFWSTETCGIDKLDLSKHSYGKLNLAYNENIIKELLSFADYSKLTEEKVMKYMDFFAYIAAY